MQLGSQQTYNSLIDKRAPNSWTQEDGGLIDFEKTYNGAFENLQNRFTRNYNSQNKRQRSDEIRNPDR